ncbi:hypothetical protein M9978_02555 [Sphingomonas sp. MG17]|uniref:Uncharacterized protein n=1 Tax=Sphingomonas tagetis TaxID=2949092 RepID=A0A9X2KN51_9SPHN|nr:hypothetical protein [Sphingomonas tagetis]MCP3729298.1 hypothetical protein [Sphingomonas tagetis]
MSAAARPRADRDRLAAVCANPRGVAFAAFTPVDLLEKLLGGTRADAQALQEQAQHDWRFAQIAVDRARTKPS